MGPELLVNLRWVVIVGLVVVLTAAYLAWYSWSSRRSIRAYEDFGLVLIQDIPRDADMIDGRVITIIGRLSWFGRRDYLVVSEGTVGERTCLWLEMTEEESRAFQDFNWRKVKVIGEFVKDGCLEPRICPHDCGPHAVRHPVVRPRVVRKDPGLTVLRPERGVVFHGSKVGELLLQCSRKIPDGIYGSWDPDESQIVRLESALTAVLAERLRGVMSWGEEATPADYYRQYGGIVVHGRRIIYVNGFSRNYMPFGNKSDWRHVAVVVCDGGDGYFGALYDPETDRIVDIKFNGGP